MSFPNEPPDSPHWSSERWDEEAKAWVSSDKFKKPITLGDIVFWFFALLVICPPFLVAVVAIIAWLTGHLHT